MSEQTLHKFDETLISGYLDGELTQGDEQRVRLHLEDCETCRGLAGELGELREATMSTEFKVPDDTQWDETPRGGLSAVFRNFGWMILLAWFAGITGFALWQIATETECSTRISHMSEVKEPLYHRNAIGVREILID